MRSSFRWVVGACFVVASLMASLPTAAALPIDGSLFWRDAARLEGVLHLDSESVMHATHRVPAGASAEDLMWELEAEHAVLFLSEYDERGAVATLASQRRDPGEWRNSTYTVDDAKIRLRISPTRDLGASQLLWTEPGMASASIEPAASSVDVRSVDPTGSHFEVPSVRDGSSQPAYTIDAPPGRFLQVAGAHTLAVEGQVHAAFFGWTISLDAPGQSTTTFETGQRATRDPNTGLQDGSVTRYLTLRAEGAAFTLPPAEGAVVYVPALRYDGNGAYPGGVYHGRHADAAPRSSDEMPIRGDIWLSAIQDNPFDSSYARAWGDAEWHARESIVPVGEAAAAGPALAIAAFAGLSFAGHILPALGRAARAGAFLLYARLRDQSPDANPTRERIYQSITQEPGQNLSCIVEQLDIGWGTAAYHIQILKRQSRIRELRFLNRVCFFAHEDHEEGKQLQVVLLRQPNYREVMTALESVPGLSQREVAVQTGHARQYISRLVAKMERAGLIRAEPGRAGRRYYPAPALVPAAPSTPIVTASPPPAPAPEPPASTPTLFAKGAPY